MEEKEFKKIMGMKTTEIISHRWSSKLCSELTHDQVLRLLKKHNGTIYISHLCKSFQFTNCELMNIVIKDSQFTRHGHVLSSPITVRENAMRSVIRYQQAFDNDILHIFMTMLSDDANTRQITYDYIKKLEKQGKIANAFFSLEKYGKEYPEDTLLLELNTKAKN